MHRGVSVCENMKSMQREDLNPNMFDIFFVAGQIDSKLSKELEGTICFAAVSHVYKGMNVGS